MKHKNGIMRKIHLWSNISEKLHFPISQFPARAPFVAQDFLDCPNQPTKTLKSQILDLKILPPNFETFKRES